MIAVFDIDGVLADATHRQHHLAVRPKDWDSFFAAVGDDAVLERGRDLLGSLSEQHAVVLLSGRPERTRTDTMTWLDRHGIEVSAVVLRADRDHRPAAVLKAELLRGIGSPEDIAIVVDDDIAVIDTLAALGYRARLFR